MTSPSETRSQRHSPTGRGSITLTRPPRRLRGPAAPRRRTSRRGAARALPSSSRRRRRRTARRGSRRASRGSSARGREADVRVGGRDRPEESRPAELRRGEHFQHVEAEGARSLYLGGRRHAREEGQFQVGAGRPTVSLRPGATANAAPAFEADSACFAVRTVPAPARTPSRALTRASASTAASVRSVISTQRRPPAASAVAAAAWSASSTVMTQDAPPEASRRSRPCRSWAEHMSLPIAGAQTPPRASCPGAYALRTVST